MIKLNKFNKTSILRLYNVTRKGEKGMKLLLAEDERRMANALIEILKRDKYDVDHVDNGADASDAIETNIYDLIILDVMMPYRNGYEVARLARKKGIKTPILILTAKSELDDKVFGLDSGADDYLTKPFETKELLARVRALLRRGGVDLDNTITYGDLTLNKNNAMLICATNNESVNLSSKEYKIIEYMMTNHNQILTREQIAMKIWGFESEAEYNNVEVYMTFARRKLSFIGSKTEIKAIRGIGYQLRYENV